MSAPHPIPRWLQPGDTVAGKFQVLRLIGQGGMGAVYEVEHVRTKKRFALKWLVPDLASNPEATERFVREAQSACALEHPNVVQIFDVDQADGGMYSLMELLRGEPLAARFQRGPVPAPELVSYLLPLLHGLEEAHERGVVHRDLKPENVFLVKGRPGTPVRPKILDFGLSKLMSEGRASEIRLTNTGMVMGTPAYMSPEQALDAAVIDARADIYAIGAMMYEALTHALPFEASSIPSLLLKVVQTPPKPPRALVPTVPVTVEQVVLRCLAKKPEQRPPSAEALAFQLCDALGLSHDHYAPGGASLSLPVDLSVATTDPDYAMPFEPTGAGTVGTPMPADASSSFSTAMTEVRLPSDSSGETERASKKRLALIAVAAVLGLVVGAAVLWSSGNGGSEPSVEPELPGLAGPTPRTAPAATPVPVLPSEEEPEVIPEPTEEATPEETEAAEAQTEERPGRRRRRSPMRAMTEEPAETPARMGATPRLEVGMVALDDF